VYDIKVVEDIAEAFIRYCNLPGDKAFFSESVQLSLFEAIMAKLKPPKNSLVSINGSNIMQSLARFAPE
jgi:hypothetical protein